MKKIFALSLSVLLCTQVFAGGTDNTSGASGVAVLKKDESIFKLIYKADRGGDVKVSIRDSKQAIVFQESIKTSDGFIRPYNFEALEHGDYTMEIVDKNGKQVETIHNFPAKVTKTFTVLRLRDRDKLMLTAAGKGKESINVKIYDGTNTLVYDRDQEISGDFAQVYNLKNVKGAITFEVTGENGESKTIYY